MKKDTNEIIENFNDNIDMLIEYLKLILERLDAMIAKQKQHLL